MVNLGSLRGDLKRREKSAEEEERVEGFRVLEKRRGVVEEREMAVGIMTLVVTEAAIAIAFRVFLLLR